MAPLDTPAAAATFSVVVLLYPSSKKQSSVASKISALVFSLFVFCQDLFPSNSSIGVVTEFKFPFYY